MAAAARLGGIPPKYRRLLTLLDAPASWNAAYWGQRGIFTPYEAGILTGHYLGSATVAPPLFPADDLPEMGRTTERDTVGWLELTRYLRNQLLRDSDVMSMATSLELRTPLVDVRLLEAIWAIPAEHRLARGKRILKDTYPDLPRWVLEQPKRGFVFPFRHWMEREWQPLMAAVEASSPVRPITWARRWSLFALDRFLQKHGLGKANG